MQHWRQAASRYVLVLWRERVAQAAHKWQQLAVALCFHKHTLQRTAAKAWLLGCEQQQRCRTAAVERLVQWRQKQLRQLALQLLRVWHCLTEQQRHLQLMEMELVKVLQQCRRQQVSLANSEAVFALSSVTATGPMPELGTACAAVQFSKRFLSPLKTRTDVSVHFALAVLCRFFGTGCSWCSTTSSWLQLLVL